MLYWGCRSKADLYMHDWAEAAAETHADLRYVPVLSEAKAEDGWTGRTGFVHQAVMHDLPEPVGAPGLCLRRADHGRVGASTTSSSRCGLPDDEFYADAFTSEADKHGPMA